MPSLFTANRTALITGASSGIGWELARALAPKLDALTLVARRRERLDQLGDDLRARHPALAVVVEAADLTDPDDAGRLLARLDARGAEVDVLINNAGLGEFELFERLSWSRIQQIVDLNVVALLRLSHHFLPAMIRRGRGVILNVGSGAGYAVMANAAVYTATKHFVRAFTESLRTQVAGAGVTVCEAAPGPVTTEFDRVAGIEGAPGSTPGLLRITAAHCAAEIVRGLERGAAVIFPGRTYRAVMRTQPLMPRRLFVAQVARAARAMRAGRGAT